MDQQDLYNLGIKSEEDLESIDWKFISQFRILSENFIQEFKNRVNWNNISAYQELSENFIREFKDKVDWSYICHYKNLSEEFLNEFKCQISEFNWEYAAKENKMKVIEKSGLYEIDGDYIIAYKSTQQGGYSVFDPNNYQYEIGNSYGLSAWTKEKALEYYSDGELYKVKIHIDDVGTLVQNSGKLRCFKLQILEMV